MSPSGLVRSLWVKPVPGVRVDVATIFAPINRSEALVVVTAPLLLVVLLPFAPTLTSSGLTGSIPLYSRIRISGKLAAGLNVTTTELLPAVAPTMFFA